MKRTDCSNIWDTWDVERMIMKLCQEYLCYHCQIVDFCSLNIVLWAWVIEVWSLTCTAISGDSNAVPLMQRTGMKQPYVILLK